MNIVYTDYNSYLVYWQNHRTFYDPEASSSLPFFFFFFLSTCHVSVGGADICPAHFIVVAKFQVVVLRSCAGLSISCLVGLNV